MGLTRRALPRADAAGRVKQIERGWAFSDFQVAEPPRRSAASTRELEAGRHDRSIDVTTRDEIGQLSAAFNRMIEQLRHKEKIRETFGRYLDPKIVDD